MTVVRRAALQFARHRSKRDKVSNGDDFKACSSFFCHTAGKRWEKRNGE